MRLTKGEIIGIGMCLGVLLVGGLLSIIINVDTPENDQIRQNEKTRIDVMQLDRYVKKFIYIRNADTGVCYGMYPNTIKSLTSVPCSDRVLNMIRKQGIRSDD